MALARPQKAVAHAWRMPGTRLRTSRVPATTHDPRMWQDRGHHQKALKGEIILQLNHLLQLYNCAVCSRQLYNYAAQDNFRGLGCPT